MAATSNDPELIARIRSAFFPHTAQRMKQMEDQGRRFVHYTSAEVAVSIIRNAEVWMRNSGVMNDYSEVDHGLLLLDRAYQGEPGKKLKQVLDELCPGCTAEIEGRFPSIVDSLRTETYLTCVSEHLPHEDATGRLSMWRAYGGRCGVALVFNPKALQLQSIALSAFGSPVLYAEQSDFDAHMIELSESIHQSRDFLRTFPPAAFRQMLMIAFQFAALSTKHPGFGEELEWRVVHSPAIATKSKLLTTSVEVVRGTPQRVYKIPLRDHPEEGLNGLAMPTLLDRIIIGPNANPRQTWGAFVDLLRDAGVERPENKVVVSNIPLRSD